jgi:hypothetical protein
MARNELFDLTQGTIAGRGDPFAFVFARRNARELSNCRPTELALAQPYRELRKLFERFGDAHALLRPARFITEHALHIFGKASEAEMNVGSGP